MAERLTKTGARNVFYGGSIFFFAIFVGLTAHSHYYIRTTSTDESTLTDSVARGKHIWEKNACINCHSILVKAPTSRRTRQCLDPLGWPGRSRRCTRDASFLDGGTASGVEGRRQMPQFNLTDEEINDLADFLEWTSKIKTQNWPPNEAG